MNLRCIYCQTPFTLGRAEMLNAILSMNEKSMNHYDAHCPRCRRANSISRQRMELFFPNWQEAARQQAAMPAPPVTAPAPTATAALRTEPLSKAGKAPVGVPAKAGPQAKAAMPGKATAKRKRSGGKKVAPAKAVAKLKKTTGGKAKPAVKAASKGKKSPVKGKKK